MIAGLRAKHRMGQGRFAVEGTIRKFRRTEAKLSHDKAVFGLTVPGV
jgi:hypothetical protein